MTDVLPQRLGQYGLTLHPTKTRLFQGLRGFEWVSP
jgi:hypothetical protein